MGADKSGTEFTLAAWHRDDERLVGEADLAYTHLHPTAFMQNLLGRARDVRERHLLTDPIDGAAVSFVDARDVAADAATVLTESGHEGTAYPVTGPEALTYEEMAAALSAALDHEVECVTVGLDQVRVSMEEMGMPAPLVDGVVGLQRWFEDGNGAAVEPTVEEVTGRPARTFEEFVADYREALA